MKNALAVLLLVGMHSATCLAATSTRSLLIVDAGTKLVYEVGSDGTLLSEPFRAPRGATSGLAYDASSETLWGASEGSDANPGRFVSFTNSGVEIDSISAASFGAHALEGIAVDFIASDTFWLVDGPGSSGPHPTIYQVDGSGSLLTSFATPLDATRPQGIAVDPFDGSLWITDNSADRIFNLDRTGAVIRSFAKGAYDASAGNPQGITVDATDGSLWITDRTTDLIYNLSPTGTLLASFASSAFDSGASSPAGIAFFVSTPEPGVLPLVGLGLVALGAHRRRIR